MTNKHEKCPLNDKRCVIFQTFLDYLCIKENTCFTWIILNHKFNDNFTSYLSIFFINLQFVIRLEDFQWNQTRLWCFQSEIIIKKTCNKFACVIAKFRLLNSIEQNQLKSMKKWRYVMNCKLFSKPF